MTNFESPSNLPVSFLTFINVPPLHNTSWRHTLQCTETVTHRTGNPPSTLRPLTPDVRTLIKNFIAGLFVPQTTGHHKAHAILSYLGGNSLTGTGTVAKYDLDSGTPSTFYESLGFELVHWAPAVLSVTPLRVYGLFSWCPTLHWDLMDIVMYVRRSRFNEGKQSPPLNNLILGAPEWNSRKVKLGITWPKLQKCSRRSCQFCDLK